MHRSDLPARRMVVLALVCASVGFPASRTYYAIETVAGADPAGDGGAAIASQLEQVKGLAVDRNRNVYISETDRHRVRKITPGGFIFTVAGTGYAGMSGDGGPAEWAQLNQPYGLAVDAAGNLLVADFGNNRVRRIGVDGSITTVAGTGEKGSEGDGGPAVAAQLMSPRNLAVDAAGNLYITEFDAHRVRKVTPDGIITRVAGIGVRGFRGDGGPAAFAQFDYPAGLAVDTAGVLYIADTGNQRVRRVYPDGTIETFLSGPAMTDAWQPVALALDRAGWLHVTASGQPVLKKYRTQSVSEIVAGTEQQPGFQGDGNTADRALLSVVNDVAVDAANNLYIADGRRVRRVTAFTRIISTIAGDAYTWYLGDNGDAIYAQFDELAALAMDGAGHLYIADRGLSRIRKAARDGSIATVAGSARAGSSGDRGPAVDALLNAPRGVAVDAVGNLYIADTGNHTIRHVGLTGEIQTVAGTGSPGQGVGAVGGPALQTPLASPYAVMTDTRGTVYVADSLNNRVLKFDTGGVMNVLAGSGTPGYVGDGGAAPQAQLRRPSGMAMDAAGNLFIADSDNHAVRKVTAAGRIGTVAGTGSAGFSGDGGPAVKASLSTPRGVAVDGDGNLYVADTGNHRIRKVTAAGIISTIAGTGTAAFGGDGGPATDAHLNAPWGLLVDGSGHVYFTDAGNHRVRKLSLTIEDDPIVVVPAAAVANAANLLAGAVAPGEMVAITAAGIGPAEEQRAEAHANRLPRKLGDAEVLFDGVAAPLFSARYDRIVAQVPYGVAEREATFIQVRYRNETRAAVSVPVAEAAPGLFTVTAGTGLALALNQDGALNAESNPAARGSIVTLYVTGEGRLDPQVEEGTLIQAPLPKPVQPVTVRIGGNPADVLFAGAAPGCAGVLQINAQVPSGFAGFGLLEVEITVGEVSSQSGVWLAVSP